MTRYPAPAGTVNLSAGNWHRKTLFEDDQETAAAGEGLLCRSSYWRFAHHDASPPAPAIVLTNDGIHSGRQKAPVFRVVIQVKKYPATRAKLISYSIREEKVPLLGSPAINQIRFTRKSNPRSVNHVKLHAEIRKRLKWLDAMMDFIDAEKIRHLVKQGNTRQIRCLHPRVEEHADIREVSEAGADIEHVPWSIMQSQENHSMQMLSHVAFYIKVFEIVQIVNLSAGTGPNFYQLVNFKRCEDVRQPPSDAAGVQAVARIETIE